MKLRGKITMTAFEQFCEEYWWVRFSCIVTSAQGMLFLKRATQWDSVTSVKQPKQTGIYELTYHQSMLQYQKRHIVHFVVQGISHVLDTISILSVSLELDS